MNRFTLPILGLAALLVVPASTHAQPLSAYTVASRAVRVPSAATAAELLGRADRLAVAGQYRRAARVYRDAAEIELRDGTLPEHAMWQEASMYYASDDTRRAASILEELGGYAAAQGNPVVQTKALLGAVQLYASVHSERALAIAGDLHALRNSPFLTAELRDGIDAIGR